MPSTGVSCPETCVLVIISTLTAVCTFMGELPPRAKALCGHWGITNNLTNNCNQGIEVSRILSLPGELLAKGYY